MIDELGLSDRLEWHAPVTATLSGGALHQLDSPMSLLRFSPLSPIARARMGMTLAVLKAMPNARLIEGRTAARWLERWMGRDAYTTVWEPLLRGKFGTAAPEIAMPWFWARVHDRTQQLGYLRGGFQQLYTALAERVEEAGGEVRLGESVTSIRSHAGSLTSGDDSGRRNVRQGGFDPSEPPHRAPGAAAARRMETAVRVGQCLRRALPDPRAGSAADIGLLDQHERPGLPVHGPRGAHELRAGVRLRRSPPRVPGQLPTDGRPAALGLEGIGARHVLAAPRRPELGLRRLLGHGLVDVLRPIRPADRDRRLSRPRPAIHDTRFRVSSSRTCSRCIRTTGGRTTPSSLRNGSSATSVRED